MAPVRSLILATQDGVLCTVLGPDGSLGTIHHTLKGIALEAVTHDARGTLYAGSDQATVYRSNNGGLEWKATARALPGTRGLWSLVAHPVRPMEIYAGTEPASLWVSRDGGDHWEELTALRNHPSARKWHFYEPTKPHVRAIAFDKPGTRLYVGIEVGGLLVSSDGGRSFEDRSHGLDEDLHTIQVKPDDPDRIFAMTGGGLFRSKDGGLHWERLTDGLTRWYMVPLAFASTKPDTLCIGAGNNPPPWKNRSADAAFYYSEDGGNRWSLSEGPFPLRGMPSSILSDPEDQDRLIAGTTDGLLLSSTDGGRHWKAIKESLPRIEEMVLQKGDAGSPE